MVCGLGVGFRAVDGSVAGYTGDPVAGVRVSLLRCLGGLLRDGAHRLSVVGAVAVFEAVSMSVRGLVGDVVVSGSIGEVVGSEVVGDTDGDKVGSEVGEIDGDGVGSELVGETDGEIVGSEVVGDVVGSEVVARVSQRAGRRAVVKVTPVAVMDV